MAKEYLGETPVTSLRDTPFEDFTRIDWALQLIADYGQTARVLLGTPVTVRLVRWDGGEEDYRYDTAEPPSAVYEAWVEERLGGKDKDGSHEYGYDHGVAP